MATSARLSSAQPPKRKGGVKEIGGREGGKKERRGGFHWFP